MLKARKKDQKETLAKLGIHFDTWFSEKSMIDNSFKLIKKFLTDNNIVVPNNDNDLLLLFGTTLFIKSIKECKKLIDELIIDFEKISECPLLSKFKNLLENI